MIKTYMRYQTPSIQLWYQYYYYLLYDSFSSHANTSKIITTFSRQLKAEIPSSQSFTNTDCTASKDLEKSVFMHYME